jgi:L-2-hydroxyglutarate oxidase LhgO
LSDFHAQTVVVGAGVIGLACAAALANSGRDVLVLEKNRGIGEEVSSRNSEVIHAGIYYAPGSLKARLCVAGKHKLYRYCDERQVLTRRLGKLIVATSEKDVETLEALRENGIQNGLGDLQWLDETEAIELEPELQCHAALLSPSTGIVDSHGLMLALQADLEAAGGQVSFQSGVHRIGSERSPVALEVLNQGRIVQVNAEEVINCAGLGAVDLAQRTNGLAPELLPEAQFSKGNYFRLTGQSPFSRLIYPAPVPGGLGIHLVLDIAGTARFGPDVEPVNTADTDLSVDPTRSEEFYQSIHRYWPGLRRGMLTPDYAGIRPKISSLGSDKVDFKLLGPKEHGIPGMMHCLGIESPGLTSSLAIADEVLALLDTS